MKKIFILLISTILTICFISVSNAYVNDKEIVDELIQGLNEAIYENHVKDYGVAKANQYKKIYLNPQFQRYMENEMYTFVSILSPEEINPWKPSKTHAKMFTERLKEIFYSIQIEIVDPQK